MLVAFVFAAALAAAPTTQTAAPAAAQAQTPARPVTLVSQVRAALTAHDLDAAEAIVAKARAAKGDTPEVMEAVSWLARGAQAEGQLDRADRWVAETQKITKSVGDAKHVDDDPHVALAVGAAMEVHALVLTARGARSEAIVTLQRELKAYGATSLQKRIQKNINLLTLEGHPAPKLDASEYIGPKPPALDALKGKVVLLFFWAHWCPDCKAMSPVLAKLYAKYRDQGFTIVAPTERYGYTARGATATPDAEKQYIVQIRDQYYPFLADIPVPMTAANHDRYGVSTTPTVVIVDRQGIIRLYHPGQMTEQELEQHLQPLLTVRSSR